jgi:hypothetical protein
LKELKIEDPLAHKNHLRMSTENFEKLLAMVDLKIRKRDVVMRKVILTRAMMKVALHYGYQSFYVCHLFTQYFQ